MNFIQSFMNIINSAKTEVYIESMVRYFAAPTVRGIKAGSLINIKRQGEAIAEVWQTCEKRLTSELDVDSIILRPFNNDGVQDSILLFIYKKEILSRILMRDDVRNILQPLGYPYSDGLDAFLKHLCERFRDGFPHEIGLFLSYPPKDVQGFIRYGGANSLAVGYWKVYGSVKRAKKAFQRFRWSEHEAARTLLRQNNWALH